MPTAEVIRGWGSAVTNVELAHDAENDADTLTRFEFLEMLVRVALFKYPDKVRSDPRPHPSTLAVPGPGI
jgi:hypothetical protein